MARHRKGKPRARTTFHLAPFVSAGVPMVRADGAFEMVPMQLFKTSGREATGEEGGFIVLRIGDNAYWFTPDGGFDGSEHKLRRHTAKMRDELQELVALSDEMVGQAPHDSYFQPGTAGWHAETDGWPEGVAPRRASSVYGVAPGDDDDDGTPPILHNYDDDE